jgi:hypothetical protein
MTQRLYGFLFLGRVHLHISTPIQRRPKMKVKDEKCSDAVETVVIRAFFVITNSRS